MPDVWSPLTTKWAVNLTDSQPRAGYPGIIDSIGHHHTAGNSLLGALQQFYPGGRTVTPNYFITPDDIYGIVPENRRAYTSASAQDDGRSITYEILNMTNDPDWEFDPRTIANVIRLDADIMRRHGKVAARYALPGFWQHRNLYEWFGRSYPTACAGPSFPMGKIIAGSAALVAGGGGGGTTPVTPEQEEDDDMARNTGIYWKRASDGKTEYMVFNPESGFRVNHSGTDGAYNNALAAAFATGSWAGVTEAHAKVIMAEQDAIQASKASGEVGVTIRETVEVKRVDVPEPEKIG